MSFTLQRRTPRRVRKRKSLYSLVVNDNGDISRELIQSQKENNDGQPIQVQNENNDGQQVQNENSNNKVCYIYSVQGFFFFFFFFL